MNLGGAAAEIPSCDNGGLAAIGRSVVWKLKRGVTARRRAVHGRRRDQRSRGRRRECAISALRPGTPFAPRDVVFTAPSPFWPGQYSQVMLVPKHLFAPYAGARSRDAPNNNRPVGTGAYTFVEFRPADLLRAAAYPRYHQAGRPHFDAIEMKGGGDAASAARAVLQTGEYDYAGSLVVEDDVLKRMEVGGKGACRSERQRDDRDLPERHRSGRRSRWRALEREDAPSDLRRPAGAPRCRPPGRPPEHQKLHLRPARHRDDQLHQQPGALPQRRHGGRVQRRQGRRLARRRRLEGRQRRHPRERRPQAQAAVPGRDQRADAEAAGGLQAGCAEGRHRGRGEGGRGERVLLVGGHATPTPTASFWPTSRPTTGATPAPIPKG